MGESGKGVVQVTDMYFYIERREMVFFWNKINSRYLKVEVHLRQLIFQNIFSDLR